MTAYATILVDTGAVARITLNRPDKRNPIGPATCGELVHALAALRDDPAVRVIVLTGAGPAFSAGGDLSAMGGGGAAAGGVAPLEAETAKLTAELAGKSPAAVALGLRAFYRSADLDHAPALRFLEGELGKVLALEDAAEGITAFLTKRPPVWKGR